MLSRIAFLITRILMKPLYWFIRPRVSPSVLPDEVEFDRTKPVCYVLPSISISDRLVLARVCRMNGLPVPRANMALPASGEAAVLYLPSLTAAGRGSDDPRDKALLDAFTTAMADPNYALQMVPVSMYWGRNPGTETSFFRVLFAHSDKPSRIRKFFMILVQGRNTFVGFSKAVDFRDFADQQIEPQSAARKLARVIRVHFSRQRTAALGPTLATSEQLADSVLTTSSVRAAIMAHKEAQGVTTEQAQAQAKKYVEEIAAKYSSTVIRILDLFLTWVWRKIFAGVKTYHAERLRSAAADHGVIYMPSHRSHFDYLLISQTLYCNGLVPPHIAAGINLNFWPVGSLLRRGGAFYIRRTFAGKKLYTAVFRAYLDVLINRGYSIEFFPEGGRSRTGRLLQPKTGVLSMALQSGLRNQVKPLIFVPVYVGYDRLIEANSYAKELSGGEKKKESASQLLSARKIFDSSYGSPYVSFGEPLELDAHLDATYPNWREEAKASDGKPEWLSELVEYVSQDNMRRINASAVLNPVALVSMILLSSPRGSIAESEMVSQIAVFLELLKKRPYSSDVIMPEGTPKEIFDSAAKLAGLEAIDHEWGRIVTASGKNAALLTYYRNNIVHLYAVPALLARQFRHQETWTGEELLSRCEVIYPLLKQELFLTWSVDEVKEIFKSTITAFVELGLLIDNHDGSYTRPDVRSRLFAVLVGLGRVLRETFERYCMANLILAEHNPTETLTRKDFELEAQQMAERMALLSGRIAPEYFDKALFRGYLNTLIEYKLVTESGDDKPGLIVSDAIRDRAAAWVTLLGPDTQQNVLQLISHPKEAIIADEHAG
jgi:glycerol-3-phosphate O-acyltransferase